MAEGLESTLRPSDRVLVSCRDVRDGDGKRKALVWEKATVRYVGNVDGQNGTWIGIEWDSAERGKHDGEVGGRRYFSCKKTWAPAPASFVREKRLKRGGSLVEEIKYKYCGSLDEDELECDMFIHTSSNHRLPVTLVGQDSILRQQSVLDELKAVYLNGSNLTHMGPAGEVSEVVPKIAELDLSSTLLGSWREVARLSAELPRLTLLDISRNDIDWAGSAAGGAVFANLRALVLNNCLVDWQTVACISANIPNLRELHVAGNRIASLRCEDVERSFGGVEALHLEENLISDWSEVETLASLPRLKKMYLGSNLLTEIARYSEENRPGFGALETLFLSDNALGSWADVDALHHLQGLKEVRVSGCKFLEKLDMVASRLSVIARLPNVTRLNGSAVTNKERVDAEIGYLGEILTESVGKEVREVEAKHPQFQRLLKSYGNINKNVARGGAGGVQDRTTIGKTLLALKISCVAALGDPQPLSEIKKKLPSNLTLNKLRTLLQRLFKVSGARVFLRREGDDEPEELVHGEDTLQQLGVENGHSLLVTES